MKNRFLKITYSLFFIAYGCTLFAQHIDQEELLQSYEVRHIEYQRMKYDKNENEFQLTEHYRLDSLNLQGQKVRSTDQLPNGQIITTDITYNDDNLKVQKTKKQKALKGISIIEKYGYNSEKRLSLSIKYKEIDEREKEKQLKLYKQNNIGLKSVYQTKTDTTTLYYNYENDRLRQINSVRNNKNEFDQVFEYDDSNNLRKSYKIKGDSKWSIIENEYSSSNQLIGRTYSKIDLDKSDLFIGLNLADINNRIDAIFYEYTYNQNTGLLSEIIEYKNDYPIAKFVLSYSQ